MNKAEKFIENKKHYGGISLLEHMKEYRTPAVSIAVVENFEICGIYTYGVRRRNKKEEITADTLFQAASISKPVFAVAVMRLAESGKIDIDRDIFEYLPDYNLPAFDNKKHKITLRQLLSHRAGLNLHGFAGYQQGQKIPTIDQILNGVFPSNNLRLKLIKEPDTGAEYSGGGYVLAQKIVTEVCGQNFNELMNDLVFSPLSMLHSTYSQPLPREKLSKIAFGYNFYNLQLPGGYNIMPELSAAGLWTTPTDLAKLGIELMKVLKNKSKFVKKDTAKTLTTKAYENSSHGVGFAVAECKKGATFGHGGSNNGYRSNMVFCPDDGSGIAVMQNSDIGEGITGEIVAAFKEAYDW